MCLIAFAWRVHPQYDLIFAANRDEFHHRETREAHHWPEAPAAFGGRDLEAGGAWCAADANGRFAAVTNVREPSMPEAGKRSRGQLVYDYLVSDASARDYCEYVRAHLQAYGAFNLLVGDRSDLFYIGNRDERGVLGVPPGIHALSNGVLGDVWPKTRRAEKGLQQAIGEPEVDSQALLALLADDTPAEDDAWLPDTGVGLQMERFLSPIFVQSPRYGTRASTVILREPDGPVHFVERGYDAHARVIHTVSETLST